MSFTDQVVSELHTLPLGKSCCQKAFLCGLLFACRMDTESKNYSSFFYREEDARKAAELIDQRFFTGNKTELFASARGGHKGWKISFSSKALANIFRDIDKNKDGIDKIIGFRCEECRRVFIRGAFISCAAINNPKSGYHLEFSACNEERAKILEEILEACVCAPRKITRQNKIGLYYKSNSNISDLLYYIRASKAGLEVANSFIEKDIRNLENRATNCVTSNILRAVKASRRHIDAINYLISTQNLDVLGDELKYTALLRVENDSVSLSELAHMHEPPISKSGLNGRLAKILYIAEEIKNGS